MSEYGIIFQVTGGLLALFFIYLTYMNTKTWRWVHVTFTFLVFVATVVFCLYAAMTLKTRAKWVKDHDHLEKQLATAEEQAEKVMRGDPKDVEGKEPSVLSVRGELSRTVVDRGRVWRGCTPSINRQTGVVTVQTATPADPNNPAAGAPRKHNIQAKTIVQAFREAQAADGSVLPASYIGEFRAMPVNDQAVALEPTMPLSPEQVAAGQAQGTWALYEVMPVDGHQWFDAEKDEDRIAPLSAAAQLERMSQPAFQQMAGPYLRDGKEAADTDPPENVWYEVKFDKEYEVTVDAPVINSIDAEPFNTEGQAVLERLRRGGSNPDEPGKVKFGPGADQINTAVLDQQTAQSLIDQGVATLQKKIYRRKLTDYERKFHSVNERLAEINGRLRQLDIDNKAMLAATAQAEEQRKLVEDLRGKINADLASVKHEVSGLEQYTTALRGRLNDLQSQLSQLYLSNKALGRELARLTADITEQVERRTREATAQAR